MLSNKAYDTLKWIVMYLVPSLATFVGAVGASLNWDQTTVVVTIITAVGTFLGGLIGYSNKQYNKEQ